MLLLNIKKDPQFFKKKDQKQKEENKKRSASKAVFARMGLSKDSLFYENLGKKKKSDESDFNRPNFFIYALDSVFVITNTETIWGVTMEFFYFAVSYNVIWKRTGPTSQNFF